MAKRKISLYVGGSKKKRSKRSSKRRAPRATGLFKKRVQSVINSNAEDKEAYASSDSYVAGGLILFNSGITSSGDLLQLLPSIGRGVGDNERTGDQITAKSLRIRGYLLFRINNAASFNGGTVRIGVRLMVISNKRYGDYGNALLNPPTGNLLKKGGSTVSFTGAPSDLHAPVNTDAYTCHYNKVMYMTQTFNTAITNIGYVGIDTRDTYRYFNFKLRCKNKLLKYDQSVAAGINPTNYAPFLVVGYCYLDGATSPDTLTTQLGLQYDSTFNYQDI